MGCPRCGSDLEEFALGDSRSSSCPACGWVGVAVDLGPGEDDSTDESWADVMGRGGRPDEAAGPPSRGDPDDGARANEPRSDPDASEISSELRTLIGIDEHQADHLAGAGIRSVDGLASADPQSLAEKLALPEEQIRPWIRRASILLVTGGAD